MEPSSPSPAAVADDAQRRVAAQPAKTREDGDPEFEFIDPVPADEARTSWPKRYQRVPKRNGEEEEVKARCHYRAPKLEETLKSNHPRAKVRNEKTDDFLSLLKEWALLCDHHVHDNNADAAPPM